MLFCGGWFVVVCVARRASSMTIVATVRVLLDFVLFCVMRLIFGFVNVFVLCENIVYVCVNGEGDEGVCEVMFNDVMSLNFVVIVEDVFDVVFFVFVFWCCVLDVIDVENFDLNCVECKYNVVWLCCGGW